MISKLQRFRHEGHAQSPWMRTSNTDSIAILPACKKIGFGPSAQIGKQIGPDIGPRITLGKQIGPETGPGMKLGQNSPKIGDQGKS